MFVFEYQDEWINELRYHREMVSEELKNLSKLWAENKDKTFEYFYDREWSDFGRCHISEFEKQVSKINDYTANYPELKGHLDWETCSPNKAINLISYLKNILKRYGFVDNIDKVIEYLSSESIESIPFIKISAMMYASLAREFARGGRRKPPNKGMFNDISMVSLLLPYCDAIFVDNECRSYLQQQPLKTQLNYNTRVFSYSNRDEFLEYLDCIRSEITTEHFDKVLEVYGDQWLKPYRELYMDF